MRTNRGFTLIELMIVVALIGVLAALSAPFLVAAKKASNEASAIGSLKAINSAQASYASTCGGNYYAAAVGTLIAGNYISPDVALAPKSGFSIAIAGGATSTPGALDCNGTPTVTGYYATSVPVGSDAGRRGFATNQAGTIWEDTTGIAPTEPFARTPTVAPIQ